MMKKTNICLISIVLVLSSLLNISCEFFNKPIKEYLKEYTESAAIEEFELDADYPKDRDGYTCLSSSSNVSIKFFLRNPQKYELIMNHDFVNDVSKSLKNTVTDSFVSTQDPEDINVFNAVIAQELLEKLECGGDFTSNLTLLEPRTQRTFNPYELKLRVNSAPQAVQNLTMLQNVSTGKYVLAFNMPDLTGIHHDIVKIRINDLEYEVKPTEDAANCGLSGDKFKTVSSSSYLPAMANGSLFSGENKPREVYYESDIAMQTEEYPFTVTLIDDYGIETSSKISASSEQLKQITVTPESLKNLPQDEKGYAHITLTAPSDNSDASVCYTVTDSRGKVVKQGQRQGSAEVLLAVGKWNVEAWAHKDGYMDSESVTKTVSVQGAIYVDSTYTGEISDGGFDTPFKSIKTAVDTAIIDAVGDVIIQLLSPCTETAEIEIKSINVTIEGDSRLVTGPETLFKVSDSKTLTLKDVIVTRGKIRVESNSSIEIKNATKLQSVELADNAQIKVDELTGTDKIASVKVDTPQQGAVVLKSVSGDLTAQIVNRFELNNPGYFLDIEEGKGVVKVSGIAIEFDPSETVIFEITGLGTPDANNVYTVAPGTCISVNLKDNNGYEITPEEIKSSIRLAMEYTEILTGDATGSITIPDSNEETHLRPNTTYVLNFDCKYKDVTYSTEVVFKVSQ